MRPFFYVPTEYILIGSKETFLGWASTLIKLLNTTLKIITFLEFILFTTILLLARLLITCQNSGGESNVAVVNPVIPNRIFHFYIFLSAWNSLFTNVIFFTSFKSIF